MGHSSLIPVSSVDYSDVQGLAAFGYGKMPEAAYLLVRVRNACAARSWIAAAPVSTAEYRERAPETALQLAFTPAGLRALGLAEHAIAGFAPEFLSGMSDANRSRRLGDTGANDPRNWQWRDDIDGIVMLYAKSNLEAWQRSVQIAPWDDGFEVVRALSTSDMGGREPFGFTDGISQPEFDWNLERVPAATAIYYNNRVALGELLLGYVNEYGKYTDRPLLDHAEDPSNALLPAAEQPAKKDLGRNGTYLVLRQLEQDVRGFWQYLNRVAGDQRYQLGAAMVGRDVNGTPLIPASKPAKGSPNDFTYDADPKGARCPFGAHIRRANPRNADLFGHPKGVIAGGLSRLAIPLPKLQDDLMASTRFHRILRRGREYGTKISPEEALAPAPAHEQPRGLHFACLCGNISRQFEFVQASWLMSTKFNGMTDENDPLLGSAGCFSIPRDGAVARRLRDVPRFITVRGGAYFFMPSLRALRYISRCKDAGTS